VGTSAGAARACLADTLIDGSASLPMHYLCMDGDEHAAVGRGGHIHRLVIGACTARTIDRPGLLASSSIVKQSTGVLILKSDAFERVGPAGDRS
jgi:hypothetical protein